ncbi:MAG: AEC family transporter [Clostridia bacterium]|nr:AEC family transporter [Clostridia bacterium]
MLTVFKQVFILFCFAMAGYILCRKKLADSSHAKLLSTLEVYIFLPCMVFKTFSSNLTVKYLSLNWQSILTSTIIVICISVLAFFTAKLFTKNSYERNIYTYSLIVPNSGYMGYALAEALFGEQALMNMMFFCIPVSVFTYTVGFCMLTKRKFTLKKLIHPVMIALVAGGIVGLSGVKIPGLVNNILNSSSNCMAPVSMLLTGMVISEFNLRKLLSDIKGYLIVFLRLIVIPCGVALVLMLIGKEEYLLSAILLFAMPCGLNTVVFPRLIDENCEIGARLACISSTLACITIPICISIFI